MDTTGTITTANQTTQATNSMELDELPKQTAKKIKATISAEIPIEPPIELLLTRQNPTPNDETPEPQKSWKSHYALHKDQCMTIQQSDIIQSTQKVQEQVLDTINGRPSTTMDARQALLEDESIYFNFETTESGPQKMEEETYTDADAISNTTVEGTRIPHQSYSSAVINKEQLLKTWSQLIPQDGLT
ncbi:16181_t:CDS:2 [Gigaspora margarita]|uniref:16181_t:CDS:1 n=1 Tax=Gigaspora margarita TaxID=4874 RepID=A0ABN7VY18_GIGMA|nr:16181_t:CDS:2 [Gigaspora margarita]